MFYSILQYHVYHIQVYVCPIFCKLSWLLLVREVHKALLTEKQEKATQEWKRRKVEKEQDGSF